MRRGWKTVAPSTTIKSLVHHDHAQTITHVQQFGCGRIMAGANSFAPHLLQNFNLPFQSPRVDRRTECPKIVMITNTIQRHTFAVQEKAIVRRKLYRADAERSFVTIHTSSALLNRGHRDVTL